MVKINPFQLYRDGFTSIQLNANNFQAEFSSFPFNIILNEFDVPSEKIEVDGKANFILRKNDEVKFAVVNGFLIDIADIDEWRGNSIIFKK